MKAKDYTEECSCGKLVIRFKPVGRRTLQDVAQTVCRAATEVCMLELLLYMSVTYLDLHPAGSCPLKAGS